MLKNLKLGSKYKALEVINMFDPSKKARPSLGYWSMTHNGQKYYLVFCNVGTPSTDIDGKTFDYDNIMISNNEFIWHSRPGLNVKNNEMLREMQKNPGSIMFFYRKADDPASLYTFFGFPQKFEQITGSKSESEDSVFSVVRYAAEDIKLMAADSIIANLDDLLGELSDTNNAKTGLIGEHWIYDILMNRKPGIEKIEKKLGIKIDKDKVTWWYLINKRKNRDFDIHDFFIEVKSSKTTLERFFMSDNERKLAEQNPKKYYFILVSNDDFEVKTWDEVKKGFELQEKRVNVFTKI